jgi:4-hydroxybenzoate polyprenyltransferase
MMRALRGWIGASHPFPLAAVVALTALAGVASTDGSPDWGRLGLALLAMLASQLAIGWSNDYLDRDADAVFQPSKPVAMGLVDARWMPAAIAIALIVSLLAGIALGLVPLAFLLIGTAAGLAYNAGVKATRFSFLPFVVALGVLPPFVWSALNVYRDELLGLYLVATPLAPAAHLANILPDFETDRAQGRRTLAVALGRARAFAILAGCLLLTLVLLALSTVWIAYDAATLAVTLVIYLGFSAMGLAMLARHGRLARAGFRCVVLGSVAFAAGWLAAVT